MTEQDKKVLKVIWCKVKNSNDVYTSSSTYLKGVRVENKNEIIRLQYSNTKSQKIVKSYFFDLFKKKEWIYEQYIFGEIVTFQHTFTVEMFEEDPDFSSVKSDLIEFIREIEDKKEHEKINYLETLIC